MCGVHCEENCPIPLRYCTDVVWRSGTGGTLCYGMVVANGTVSVPVRYRFGMGGAEMYNNVWCGAVRDKELCRDPSVVFVYVLDWVCCL